MKKNTTVSWDDDDKALVAEYARKHMHMSVSSFAMFAMKQYIKKEGNNGGETGVTEVERGSKKPA